MASFLLQLPKPLGFGKVSKLQKLTEFQHMKSLSITTELAIIAGLCESINAGTPVLKKMKLAFMFTLKTLTKIICCCLMRRKKKKKKKSSEPEESEEVDYEGKLGQVKFPRKFVREHSSCMCNMKVYLYFIITHLSSHQ